MIRILIVGDQPDVRKGLLMRLAAEADFSVIGAAGYSEAVLQLARTNCPKVVLVDIDLLLIDGFSAVGKLRSACPQSSIILLSLHDDALTQANAQASGAAAFVAKSLPSDTLLTTIRQVANLNRYANAKHH